MQCTRRFQFRDPLPLFIGSTLSLVCTAAFAVEPYIVNAGLLESEVAVSTGDGTNSTSVYDASLSSVAAQIASLAEPLNKANAVSNAEGYQPNTFTRNSVRGNAYSEARIQVPYSFTATQAGNFTIQSFIPQGSLSINAGSSATSNASWGHSWGRYVNGSSVFTTNIFGNFTNPPYIGQPSPGTVHRSFQTTSDDPWDPTSPGAISLSQGLSTLETNTTTAYAASWTGAQIIYDVGYLYVGDEVNIRYEVIASASSFFLLSNLAGQRLSIADLGSMSLTN
jgi:hypothetical protein